MGAGLAVDTREVLLGHIVVAHGAIDRFHLLRVRDFSGLDVAIRALHEAVDGLREDLAVRLVVVTVGASHILGVRRSDEQEDREGAEKYNGR
jgi:hypothetical protein